MSRNVWMPKLFKRFRPEPPDFLDLCEQNVCSVEDIVSGGNLLNHRQCLDLSSKLSKTTQNIRKLVEHCRGSAYLFRPSLEDLYRYLEKVKVLVSKCGEEHWWAAAVFQCQNENAFRDILLDVSLCYNAIYEQAYKSAGEEWNFQLEDLRQSSVFLPATVNDVQEDQQDLQLRLEVLAKDPSSVKVLGHSLPEELALKAQCLTKYLLLKIHCASEQSQATTLDSCSEILWQKDTEPPGTWGNSHYLGGGATDGGVCRTEWLGIPCAKKEFHVKEYESLFLKEAGILAHLKHPCIINFICCSNGQERGDRFIAMELMEMSLLDLIQDQNDKYISLPVVVDIIVQIARGMCYLHDQGVAHRDLKPQNVVVNRFTSTYHEDYYCVKLVDFGTSKIKVEVSKSNTMTYRGIGTSMYRAPEVYPSANSSHRSREIKGRAVWFKADVFSFAMTCAHVLTQKVPFQDTKVTISSNELYNELMNGRRPNLPRGCPQELLALLRDCWNTIPRRRPSFMDICTRLETIKHKVLRGLHTKKMESGEDLDFIKTKMEEQSSFQKVFSDITNPEVEGDCDFSRNDVVSIISCTSGCALELLDQPPYSTLCRCNVCSDLIDGEVYHCKKCHFDAHLDCAHIKDKVKVFFHHHPLHLLIQNYYSDHPDAICRFCEEPLQDCKWVYRCEQCNFDVHALCTKYPMERMWKRIHPHLLTLTQCPPRQSLVCTRCNGKIRGYTWRYTCGLKSCAFDLHPFCVLLPRKLSCIFDCTHLVSLAMREKRVTCKRFSCGSCGALGFSWAYHCDHCDVDIHPDCADDIVDEKEDWNETYEKIMVMNGSIDDYTKMNMISELLDTLPVGDALEGSSSSISRPPGVVTRVQASIQKLTLTERPSLDASNDVNLKTKIAAETAERIEAKKMAAKEASQKLKANRLEMLEKLEKVILDLQSSENMSQADAEVLAATQKKLKRRQNLVKEQIAMQGQYKMSQAGPRIGVFFHHQSRNENRRYVRELLASLQSDIKIKGVYFALLCEEPGHEHIVDSKWPMRMSGSIGPGERKEEFAEKVQPLLASGLQVVRKTISTLEPHELTGLESVTLPTLEAEIPWDLRAIEVEMNGNRSTDLFEDKENMEALKRAEASAAEWFLSYLENDNTNILKMFGLQRVRYRVTQQGDFPHSRRSTFAWLCTDHLNSGLKDGTLESYPLKYHNVEDDYHLRFPVARRFKE